MTTTCVPSNRDSMYEYGVRFAIATGGGLASLPNTHAERGISFVRVNGGGDVNYYHALGRSGVRFIDS